MSIINEALKKTGEYIQQGHGAISPATVKPKKKTYLIYVLVLAIGLALGNFALNYFGYKTIAKDKPLPTPTVNLTGLQAKETAKAPIDIAAAAKNPSVEAPTPATENSNSSSSGQNQVTPILNGIFFSNESSYALINNEIAEVGDSLGSAKVTKITADTVELLDAEGKAITLSTKNL